MNTIVKGSVEAVAKQAGTSIAATFLNCEVMILCDTSGSMSMQDSTDGRSRYEQACKELEVLQQELPGKIAIVSFSRTVEFCANGVPRFLGSTTNLTAALTFAKQYDLSDMRFLLISDGQPDDETSALDVAKTFSNKINVIYVGSELERSGRRFLKRLSEATGGKTVTALQVAGLANEARKLLGIED